MKLILVILGLTLSAICFAGTDSYECQSMRGHADATLVLKFRSITNKLASISYYTDRQISARKLETVDVSDIPNLDYPFQPEDVNYAKSLKYKMITEAGGMLQEDSFYYLSEELLAGKEKGVFIEDVGGMWPITKPSFDLFICTKSAFQ